MLNELLVGFLKKFPAILRALLKIAFLKLGQFLFKLANPLIFAVYQIIGHSHLHDLPFQGINL